jgi:hypothetical protein
VVLRADHNPEPVQNRKMYVGPVNVGEQHYNCKLTRQDVLLIRLARLERKRLLDEIKQLSYEALAEKFGVKKSAVYEAAHGITWRSVPFPEERK